MLDMMDRPRPGSLEEALAIRVWAKRRSIERFQRMAQLLASMGQNYAKEATKFFDQATQLEYPSTGDIKPLDDKDKQAVAFLNSLTGKAFKITVDSKQGLRRIKSRLNMARQETEQKERLSKWRRSI